MPEPGPSNQERQLTCESVIELTRAAVRDARNGEWESVARLEARRRPMLERLFARDGSSDDRERLLATAREIITADTELVAIAKSARAGLAEKMAGLKRTRSATQAYASASLR